MRSYPTNGDEAQLMNYLRTTRKSADSVFNFGLMRNEDSGGNFQCGSVVFRGKRLRAAISNIGKAK